MFPTPSPCNGQADSKDNVKLELEQTTKQEKSLSQQFPGAITVVLGLFNC